MIVEDGEIGLVEIANELAVTVGGDEEHIDLIDTLFDGKDGLVGRVVGGVGKGGGGIGIGRDGGRGVYIGIVLGEGGDGKNENGRDDEGQSGESTGGRPDFDAFPHYGFLVLFYSYSLCDSRF